MRNIFRANFYIAVAGSNGYNKADITFPTLNTTISTIASTTKTSTLVISATVTSTAVRSTTIISTIISSTTTTSIATATSIVPNPNEESSRVDRNLAAVSWGDNRIDLFTLSDDNSVYHKSWDGKSWQPAQGWENLGGPAINFSAVTWGKDHLEVFIRANDNAIYRKTWDVNSWRPSRLRWENLNAYSISEPRAVSWGPNRTDVFIIDTYGQVLHRTWDGKTWIPTDSWENLGGKNFSGNIVPISLSPNFINLFICSRYGADNIVFHKEWIESAWRDWGNFGGPSMIDVSVVVGNGGTMDLFAYDAEHWLYHREFANFWPSTIWDRLFVNFFWGKPSAASQGGDRIHLFTRDYWNRGFHRVWDRKNVPRDGDPWNDMGFFSSDLVPVWSGPNQLNVFARSLNNTIIHKVYDGKSWSVASTLN